MNRRKAIETTDGLIAAATEETPSPPSDAGEGRGEEEHWMPLSSVLSPLLRREERKKGNSNCGNSTGGGLLGKFDFTVVCFPGGLI
jgi:hypothetical protein